MTLLAVSATTMCPLLQAGHEILGCATRAKDRITPSDTLDCQGAADAFTATLASLYADGWRLIDAEYFNSDEPVFYLERPLPADPAASP